MEKVLMFSIDGATWKVIKPMMEKGQLPNMARMLRTGASGVLHSIRPLVSPMLWTTIATGKGADKHGVKLFGDTSKSVRCKRIWQLFEERGYTVGLCGYLVTWPPEITNGFLIPDLFALGPETYPPELQFLQEFALSERQTRGESPHGVPVYAEFARKLLQNGVRFSTLRSAIGDLAYVTVARPPALERFWRKWLLQPRLYADVFSHLYAEYKPAYAAFHFHPTDTLSHRFWKYRFPEDFEDVAEADVTRYGHVVPRAYQEADQILGRFLGMVDRETTVMVLSDHGFRSIPPYPQPNLNIDLFMRAIQAPDDIIPTHVGISWYLVSKAGGDRGIPENVVEQLSGAHLRETGSCLFKVTERPDYVQFALPREQLDPDDIIAFPGGESFRVGELWTYEEETVNSGAHEPEGIVMLHGDKIKAGTEIEGMTLLDVTPTLLALAGLPVASDMDGQVMVGAIEEAFLQSHPLSFIDSHETEAYSASDEGITPEERDKVMDRLKALGYL